MRTKLLLLVALASACTKHNPESCCTTDAQCQAFGLDGVIGCAIGEVCNANGACVATQCTTSADCTDPTTPICINQVCVASCTTDADCTGASGGPHCGSAGACVECDESSQCMMATAPVCDATTSSCRGCQTNTDCGSQVCDTATGACVECTTSSECSAAMPVCDSTTNMCRGCIAGSECPSGVCLDANGTCADETDVRYVTEFGHDVGTCTKAAPCGTIAYTISQASGATQIIHITGGAYSVESEVDLASFSGTIDAEDTVVTSDDGSDLTSVFSISDGDVTFSNIAFGSGHEGITMTGGNVSAYEVNFGSGTGMAVNGGTAVVEHSTVYGSIGVGNSGNATVETSTVYGTVGGRDGVLNVERTLFENGRFFSVINLTLTIVNNVFVSSTGSVFVSIVSTPMCSIQFNTFVNTSGATPPDPAISCATNTTTADNIFAWETSTPATDCSISYSLFDDPAAVPATGSGNISGAISAFFTNFTNHDFHLATGSPAIGAADPGSTVTTDFDGNPRPNPAGSTPDIGAFEAP